MKWVFLFLFVLLTSVFLGVFITEYPGYVQIYWFNYEIRVSAIIFTLLLLFLFIAFYAFSRILSKLFTIRSLFSNKDKKDQIIVKLFLAFQAEQEKEAVSLQKKWSKVFKNDPLFLWISGRIFEKANDHLAAEQCFLELSKNPSTLFLGLKGLIRAALHRGDRNQAYDFLKRAQEISSSSPWILKHLLALTRQKKKYEEEEVLILQLEDLGCITPEQSKKQIAQSQYEQALNPKVSDTQKEAFLRQAHYLDASHVKATEALVPLLISQGEKTYARTVIEETWVEAPCQSLGDLYLNIDKPKNELAAFEKAQELISHNPDHNESLLFFALKALDAKLWGEARKALLKLIVKNPTADAFQLCARLELEGNKDEKTALKWLEEGLKAPRHV